MRIINGPKWLNVANMMRNVKVAPLTVSDNMIADNYLLALLMTACKPGDFLIFMDATIEQQLFADLNIGPKYNGLKSQFLCTDLEEGISRMITPYEEAAAKTAEAERIAKEEQAEMASYKEKYEKSTEFVAKLTEGLKLANSELTKLQDAQVRYEDALTEKSNTIDELRSALKDLTSKFDAAKIEYDKLQEENQKLSNDRETALAEIENRNNQTERLHEELDSANQKIESMREEFNAACKEFGLSKDKSGKWTQDLMKVIEYTELKKQAEELSDALTTANDLVASQKNELEAQDEQIVKLHTIIGKASAKFNAVLDGDEWKVMTAEDKTEMDKSIAEDPSPEVAEEFTEKINEAAKEDSDKLPTLEPGDLVPEK